MMGNDILSCHSYFFYINDIHCMNGIHRLYESCLQLIDSDKQFSFGEPLGRSFVAIKMSKIMKRTAPTLLKEIFFFKWKK